MIGVSLLLTGVVVGHNTVVFFSRLVCRDLPDLVHKGRQFWTTHGVRAVHHALVQFGQVSETGSDKRGVTRGLPWRSIVAASAGYVKIDMSSKYTYHEGL